MKTSYKFIKFEEVFLAVKGWGCLNKKTGDILGIATFYPEWRQWVMDFKEASVFNKSCLEDIAHFLGQLNEQHRLSPKTYKKGDVR